MHDQSTAALIHDHLRRHAGVAAADLAKLLYQGVMGMDHLLRERETFLADLGREWETLDPAPLPGEALVEPVHPAGEVVRLNLRPLKATGASLAEVGAFLSRQPLRQGDLAEFRERWEDAVALARGGQIPFAWDELVSVGQAVLARGHPPGHSAQYRRLNRPAYRLIHDATHPEARRVLPAGHPWPILPFPSGESEQR